MKNILRKSPILFLIVIFFTLSACTPTWAKDIAEMKTTWQSETANIEFTVSENDYTSGFGSATNTAGEDVDILFCWSASTVKFLIYLVVDNETNVEKITTEDNIILYGKYAYHSKNDKQVKLTVEVEKYADKLLNGLYDSIILTAIQ